ncbi:MAG: site-specific integrase [Bacilli bacterium]
MFYAIMYVAFWTGARRGELLALKWSDVDLDRKRIYIQKAHTVVTKRFKKGKVKGQTKTDPSIRVIAISDDLCQFLYHYREEQNRRKETIHYEDNKGLMFTSFLYGRMLSSSELTLKLNDAQIRAGLQHIRLHDSRHTHVTIALKNGADLVTVSRRVGHSRVSTTADYYAHVVDGADQEVADLYAKAMNLDGMGFGASESNTTIGKATFKHDGSTSYLGTKSPHVMTFPCEK